MADTKISAMTDAGAMDGTEQVPMVQGGANVKTTWATRILTYLQGAISITSSRVSDFNTAVRTSRLDQMAAPTASVSLNSQKITNVLDPTAAQDAATKTYVDAVATLLTNEGLRTPCRAATTAALATVVYANGASGVGATISGFALGALGAIDGVTLIVGDRLLVKNQAAALQNGIYTVTAVGSAGAVFVLTRATDYDTSAEIFAGTYTYITEGTANGGGGFIQTATGALTIGTDSINFTQFTGAGEISVTAPITKSGNTIGITSPLPVANGGTNAATANANVVFAGPTSGGAAAPSFRTIVAADLPFTPQMVEFTSSGSTTIPTGSSVIECITIGGGGGGGSGRRGAAGSARFGGGGAAGGAYSVNIFSVAEVGGTGTSLTITVGAAGTGGAAQTSNDTDGVNGVVGGDSRVAAGATTLCNAVGGSVGSGGTASAGGGGSAISTGGSFIGATGASSSTSATPSTGSGAGQSGGGGGAGGGIDTSDVARPGSNGGSGGRSGTSAGNGGGGGNTGVGGGTPTATGLGRAGAGGGGGGGSTSAAGGAGGVGGTYGGAGGGGGAGVNGNNSGAGGNGGPGYVRIIYW